LLRDPIRSRRTRRGRRRARRLPRSPSPRRRPPATRRPTATPAERPHVSRARGRASLNRSMRRSGLPPFEDFMEEHRVMVYRFLMASAGPAEADDCFQETFLSALKASPALRPDSNLKGWVLTIATNKVIDMARSRGRRAVPVADPDSGAATEDGP